MVEITTLTQELIAIPSLSGKEKAVQEFLFQKLTEMGSEPFFQGENLVLHLKGKDGSRSFVFNSHVDVVDPGEISRWKYSPWEAVIAEDRLYGRGAADMKAGVAASATVAKELLKQKDDLPTDVWFVFVTKEETDGSGTKSFTEWFKSQGYWDQYQQIGAVFTEPTNLISAGYGCRGNYFIKAEVKGDAGHASMPQKINVNAPKIMVDFICSLDKENKDWSLRFKGCDFIPPSITTTGFNSQSGSPNKVPDQAEAVFDLRTIPSFHQEALERVKEVARKFGVEISLLCSESPPCLTSSSSKIILTLKNLVTGLKIETLPYATDMSFFGSEKIEGIIFGPGDPSQAHVIDEFVSLEQLNKAPLLYKELYFAWAK